MRAPAAVILALSLAGVGGPRDHQDGLQDAPGPATAAPASAPSAAQELWRAIGEATRVAGVPRRPVESFHLSADVLTREKAQTNEFTADYRYLAPGYIRFKLESDRETAKGPDGYWLRDPAREETIRLEGREYAEDRQLVDRMLAVARNFLALTDPARLRTPRPVERLDAPPEGLPAKLAERARELEWISVVSPDFALVPSPSGPPPAGGERLFRARIGADPRTRYPVLAVVEEAEPSARAAAPVLFELGATSLEVDGYRIPKFVHVRYPRAEAPGSFPESPAQEIYLRSADLDPPFTPRDFEPR